MQPAAIEIDFVATAEAARPQVLRSAAVAVIDVLRATTTITAALRAGCQRVIPCTTIAQARRLAKTWTRLGQRVWLAGERNGRPILGFDAGNSAAEFQAARRVVVILTTSNGTRALQAAQGAQAVFTACLNNLAAVGRALFQTPAQRWVILAAGELGHPSPEDNLTAGLLIRTLLRLSRQAQQPGPRLTRAAEEILEQSRGFHGRDLEKTIQVFPHAQELIHYGFGQDVHFASQVNSTRMVGYLSKGSLLPVGPV